MAHCPGGVGRTRCSLFLPTELSLQSFYEQVTTEQLTCAMKGMLKECGETYKKGDDWGRFAVSSGSQGLQRTAFGDACGVCWKAYTKGKFNLMNKDFAEFAQRCRTDASMKGQFIGVMRILNDDDEKQFTEGEVLRGEDTGIRVLQNKIAVTPDEFTARFARDPGDLGLKQRDCVRPNGTKFKGIIMIDDGSWPTGVGVKYEYFRSLKVSMQECKMERASHTRAESLKELFLQQTSPAVRASVSQREQN